MWRVKVKHQYQNKTILDYSFKQNQWTILKSKLIKLVKTIFENEARRVKCITKIRRFIEGIEKRWESELKENKLENICKN